MANLHGYYERAGMTQSQSGVSTYQTLDPGQSRASILEGGAQAEYGPLTQDQAYQAPTPWRQRAWNWVANSGRTLFNNAYNKLRYYTGMSSQPVQQAPQGTAGAQIQEIMPRSEYGKYTIPSNYMVPGGSRSAPERRQ